MKITFNKNKIELIFKTLSIILTIIYIIFILWSRLFRVRLPRNLDGNYTIIQLTFFSLLFLGTLILCFYTLRIIFVKKKPTENYNDICNICLLPKGVFFLTHIS